jgi:hypothetical protein
MSNTFPNFLLKSDITVRHSVVSLPTTSTLHWQEKRFRAKKFYCWVCPGSFGKPTPKRRPENQSFLQCETTKGPGRSHADRGLKLGDRKGVIFAPGRNLNAFYEAFMTGLCLIRLGRSTKKYLRTNIPWRPRIEPPQLKHLTSRSGIGWGGTSMRTISYFAPQLGQSNGTDCGSDINATPRIAL